MIVKCNHQKTNKVTSTPHYDFIMIYISLNAQLENLNGCTY